MEERPRVFARRQGGEAMIGCALLAFINEFIRKKTSPAPLSSPSRGEDGSKSGTPAKCKGCNISPPLRVGDERDGEIRGFTCVLISIIMLLSVRMSR